MKSLIMLLVFCLGGFNAQLFAKDKLPVLKKEKEIKIHNKLKSIVNGFVKNEPTGPRCADVKKEITNLVENCQDLIEINNKVNKSYWSNFEIGYEFKGYRYYYSVVRVDSIIDFSENRVYIKITNLEDDNLSSKMQFEFDNHENLVKYNYNYDGLSIKATYLENGNIYKYSKKINDNYVGLRYDRFSSSNDLDIDEFGPKDYSNYLMVGDYSDPKKVGFIEYKIIGNDTLQITQGNFNRSGNSVKIGTWKTSYANGRLKKIHVYEDDGYRSQLNGKEYYFYENGDTALANNYDLGVRVGTWKAYYKNKTVKYKKQYSNGVLTGDYFENHENGNPKVTGQYDEIGQKYGKWKWFDDDNTIKKLETYNLDELEGVSKIFINGQYTDSVYYKNGSKEGQRLLYYTSYSGEKELKGKLNYLNNKLEGPALYYHKYGFLKDTAFYKNGFILGEQKHFYGNGKLEARINYPLNVNDRKSNSYDGPVVYYFRNGNLRDTAFYINGNIQGAHTKFHENNNPEIITTYDDGFPLKVRQYYENGGLKKQIVNYPKYDYLNDSEGGIKNKEITEYFENGKLKRHLEYGEKDAYVDSVFFEDGKIKEITGENTIGEKHGKQYSDIAFGTFSLSNYTNGIKDGIQIYKEENYIDSTFANADERTIHSKSYFEGKLKSEKKYRYGILESYTNKDWIKQTQRKGLKKIVYFLSASQEELDAEDEIYVEDYIIGDKTTYSLFGRKIETHTIKNVGDYEEASKVEFYRNGKVKKISEYYYENDYGKVITYNKKGLITSFVDYDYEQAKLYEYYVNGSLYKKEMYGYDEGYIEEIYFPNGNLNMKEISYLDYDIYSKKIKKYYDDESGKETTFYNEKGVKISEEFIYPYESKIFTTYYPNGKIKTKKEYMFLENYNGEEDFMLTYYEDYYESGFIKTFKSWGEYGTFNYGTHYNDDAEVDKRGKVIKNNTIKH